MNLRTMANAICNGAYKAFDLTMIVPFKEGDKWYFQLRYHVVKADGEEGEVIIPKINSPFPSENPVIDEIVSYSSFNNVYIMSLVTDEPRMEKTNYEGHRDCVFYYVKTKDAPVKEMTHEEIEEKLGHPFKEVKKKGGK